MYYLSISRESMIVYTIHREYLLNILRQFKQPQKLITLIKANILYTKIKINIFHKVTFKAKKVPQRIPVTTELRQGDALSLILINKELEKIIREIHIEDNRVQLSGCIIGALAIQTAQYYWRKVMKILLNKWENYQIWPKEQVQKKMLKK